MLFDKPTDAIVQEAHAEDTNEITVDNNIVLDLVIKKQEDLDVKSCYIYIKDYETGKDIEAFNLPLKSLMTIQKDESGYNMLVKEYVSEDEFNNVSLLLDKDTLIEFCNINAEVSQYNTNTEITPLEGYTNYVDDRARLVFRVESGMVESFE